MSSTDKRHFRQIAEGERAVGAVLVVIGRDGPERLTARMGLPWIGSSVETEKFGSVEEALAQAEAKRVELGLAEVVVRLDGVAWQDDWGTLQAAGPALSESEAFELARATEASRDA